MVAPTQLGATVPSFDVMAARAADYVDRLAPSATLRDSLRGLLSNRAAPTGRSSSRTMGELAALCAAAGGAEREVCAAAGAVAVLAGTGIDLLDDLVDGDSLPDLCDWSPGHVLLAATTLVSAIAYAAIAELPVAPARRQRLSRRLAAGLLDMSAGEIEDVAAQGRDIPPPAAVEASVLAKTGEEMATSAGLGAIAAGASKSTARALETAARHYGVALQVGGDVNDLAQLGDSRDFAAGARTLPIAYHAATIDGERRASFRRLLDAAQRDKARRLEVLELLRGSGSLRRAALVAEIHHQTAISALNDLAAEGQAVDALSVLIGGCSVYGRGSEVNQRQLRSEHEQTSR